MLCLFAFTQTLSANCTAAVPDLTITELNNTQYGATWTTTAGDGCYFVLQANFVYCDGFSNGAACAPVSSGFVLDLSTLPNIADLTDVVKVNFRLQVKCMETQTVVAETSWIPFERDAACCNGEEVVLTAENCNPEYLAKHILITMDCEGNYKIKVLNDNVMMVKLFRVGNNTEIPDLFLCNDFDQTGSISPCNSSYEAIGTLPDLSENWYFDIQFLDGSSQCRITIPFLGKRNGASTLINNTESAFTIYPNPAQNVINISDMETADYRAEIFSINGATIYQQNINAYEDRSIDIAHLQNGTYLLQLTNTANNKTSIQKFSVFK